MELSHELNFLQHKRRLGTVLMEARKGRQYETF